MVYYNDHEIAQTIKTQISNEIKGTSSGIYFIIWNNNFKLIYVTTIYGKGNMFNIKCQIILYRDSTGYIGLSKTLYWWFWATEQLMALIPVTLEYNRF